MDAKELLPGAYSATVWASHSGDKVLRREVPVTAGQTMIELASDVDHIGFAIYRAVDRQCVDWMEVFLIMEVGVRMEIESGPTLHFHDRRGRPIHKVNPSGSISTIYVRSDNDSAELDKEIRRLWLDRRVHEHEAAARRKGKFARFRPDEFDQAVQYFIGLLRQDSDQTAPIYLADPYFMSQGRQEFEAKLYIDMFASTTGQPLRILCSTRKNGDAPPWWANYPNQITDHVSVRTFLERNEYKHKHGFHDRYLITPKREIIITHSFNGWSKHGVTFASLPYDVYRAEAEQLWSMDIESTTTRLLVQEID